MPGSLYSDHVDGTGLTHQSYSKLEKEETREVFLCKNEHSVLRGEQNGAAHCGMIQCGPHYAVLALSAIQSCPCAELYIWDITGGDGGPKPGITIFTQCWHPLAL